MKKIIYSAMIIAIIGVLFYGVKNHYHWLLQPKGAILAAVDISEDVARSTGKDQLWVGISPELGFMLLQYVDLSANSPPGHTWLTFCLNLYQRSYEKEDPDRAARFFSVAQYLVDSGVGVNTRPVYGFTALETALLAADYKMYNFLVKNGVDTSMKLIRKNYEGLSPLEFAKEIRKKNISGQEKAEDLDKIIRHLEGENITFGSS